MARIRTIKPDFFTSEQIAECSTITRLLFIGMWCFCDDQGIHPASTKSLKMQVFPADDITQSQIEECINELINQELIFNYAVNGKEYWKVTGWQHQKIDKPTKKYPLPDAVVERSANGSREVNDSSPPEGKGKEKEPYQEEGTISKGIPARGGSTQKNCEIGESNPFGGEDE